MFTLLCLIRIVLKRKKTLGTRVLEESLKIKLLNVVEFFVIKKMSTNMDDGMGIEDD